MYVFNYGRIPQILIKFYESKYVNLYIAQTKLFCPTNKQCFDKKK